MRLLDLKNFAERLKFVFGMPMELCPKCKSHLIGFSVPIKRYGPVPRTALDMLEVWAHARAKAAGQTPIEGTCRIMCRRCGHLGPSVDVTGRTAEDVGRDPVVAAEVKRLWNEHATIPQPPPLPYTPEESKEASDKWKASCGPHSIAAACGVRLDIIREALPPFSGWMSPTMIGQTLKALRRPYTLKKGLKTAELCNGINRVQFEGSWLNPGVHPRIAYFHTHYVAHRDGWVLCTACTPDEWLPVETWRVLLAEHRSFHITHHYCLP